ncbi:type II toxin-antitoxin system VapB family antitoxin [Paraburkholderia edwinii]|jgi:Arc/MetJ family transcription regulator|uniref:Type II toxin-antitoxin system VapB family antitoxin n=1 Tax=Paraburkholderia edwinii TaxID=2861782 RepID=A0ABX8ULB5_9BURK|nr:type II toxin-antitoxin system VapB family antitoxin [Paraburkholderia edwinii]QYD69142.1 type II toxin-antitoxin system VapB family antitoxin [Paraburkholderia edwinii]
MRTTIALDDDLIAKAQAYTGLEEKTAIVREALKALIEREAASRLAKLGGSQPRIKGAPRRRQGDSDLSLQGSGTRSSTAEPPT